MTQGRDVEFWRWVEHWVQAEERIESAVLFGSSATRVAGQPAVNAVSDFDLHIISAQPAELEATDWRTVPGSAGFVFRTVRPATGGVRKMTVIFESGQIDLVIVPERQMQAACWAVRLGWHRRSAKLAVALNEMATCLHSGYRFVKGERRWGGWYARVANEMPGVRLSPGEIRRLADNALTDALWILQKLGNAELIAAQHLLHRSLVETNLRLIRETRLRRGDPLRSFGLGRRIETWATAEELTWVRTSARLEQGELTGACRAALTGLRRLMAQLEPTWAIPPEMAAALRLRAE